jgi:hypothetical protein
MNVIWLCRYISGICVLLFVMGSLISYAPSAETFMILHQTIAGCGAFIAALLAIVLNRLPRSHWIHQSKPLWVGFVAVAVAVTVLVAFGG